MKKATRVLTLVLLAVVAFSFVLSGCGTAGNTTETTAAKAAGETTAAAAETTKAAEPLKPYTIQWYFVGGNVQPDNGMVEQKIDEYLKDKINAQVKLNLLDWGTYPQKMATMLAASDNFDIFFLSSWMLNYPLVAQKGQIVELDKYFADGGLLADTRKVVGDMFLNASKINGKNYAIPCNKEKCRVWGFVYNKTLDEKYSLDTLNTVKDLKTLEPIMKTIKEKEPNVIPLHFNGPAEVGLLPWDPTGDWMPVIRDGKAVIPIEQPELMDLFSTLRDFYNKGYIRKDALSAKDAATVEKTGRFMFMTMNLKPGYSDEKFNTDPTAPMKFSEVYTTPITMCNADTMGSMQAISVTSGDPDRCAMFLNLVNTDPVLNNLINYGIEGTHYTTAADGRIQSVKDSKYAPTMQWMFGNQFINKILVTESPDKWKNFEAFNAKAVPAGDLGFIFNFDSVKNEWDAVNKVNTEYFDAIQKGTVDPNDAAKGVPAWLAKTKAAGVDKIVAEMQKQFDAFKAAAK